MTEYLANFVKARAAVKQVGSVQKTVLISHDHNDRLQAMAATLKASEAELIRAMIESGLIDLEALVEAEDIPVPGRKRR